MQLQYDSRWYSRCSRALRATKSAGILFQLVPSSRFSIFDFKMLSRKGAKAQSERWLVANRSKLTDFTKLPNNDLPVDRGGITVASTPDFRRRKWPHTRSRTCTLRHGPGGFNNYFWPGGKQRVEGKAISFCSGQELGLGAGSRESWLSPVLVRRCGINRPQFPTTALLRRSANFRRHNCQLVENQPIDLKLLRQKLPPLH